MFKSGVKSSIRRTGAEINEFLVWTEKFWIFKEKFYEKIDRWLRIEIKYYANLVMK